MIRSVQNPRVKQVAKLQRQGRQRRRLGLFCVETWRELARALAAGFEPAELYDDPQRVTTADQRQLIEQVRQVGAAVEEVTGPVLAKMAYREHPQGVVAVLHAKPLTLGDLGERAGGIVVCSGLEKPGNVGAILRSAAGVGVAAVVVDRADFDLYNPHTVRASTGAVFTVPVVCVDRSELIGWLEQSGRQIVALSPEAEPTYTDHDWRQPWALVLGAEAEGLDAAWRSAADAVVRIPLSQAGGVDSLNVSVAAAVVLFEAQRQVG